MIVSIIFNDDDSSIYYYCYKDGKYYGGETDFHRHTYFEPPYKMDDHDMDLIFGVEVCFPKEFLNGGDLSD